MAPRLPRVHSPFPKPCLPVHDAPAPCVDRYPALLAEHEPPMHAVFSAAIEAPEFLKGYRRYFLFIDCLFLAERVARCA